MNRVADSSKQNATASDSADTIFDEPPNAAPTAVEVDKPRNKNLRIDSEKETGDTEAQPAAPKTFRFYAIILALSFSGLLTALEGTITSTALPTIIFDLGGEDLYIWVVNGFLLTQTAFQPLFGQIANIYGRRWPMILSAAAFTLGSGICGGATNMTMLITGRVIQGVGAGGVNVLIEIIVCDLLPLRERGKYLGLMFGIIALGTALGPLFGGLIVQHVSWRWVFYLNLPVGGVTLVALVSFLRVRSDETTPLMVRIKRVDWTGNAIFTLAMVSLLISLSWAGAKYSWSSFRIIVPLVMGFSGFGIFLLYEKSPLYVEETMPIHLFSNRTSAITFVLTFLHSLSAVSTIYFLPVYFQGVLGASPSRAGTAILPAILILIPFAIIAGATLSKYGRYRPLHHIGLALMIIGFGLLSLLDLQSSTAKWVIYQCVAAAGAGLVLPVLLPAVQASLAEADTALSTSTWSFVRSFGQIWGATIPATVFNNRFESLSYRITDPVVAATLSHGGAYEHATKAFLGTITDEVTQDQVMSVFADSLRTVWYVSIGFAGLGFLLVFIEKEIPLRKELETKFGMEEKEKPVRVCEPPSEQAVAQE